MPARSPISVKRAVDASVFSFTKRRVIAAVRGCGVAYIG